jgi:hypothetical protein
MTVLVIVISLLALCFAGAAFLHRRIPVVAPALPAASVELQARVRAGIHSTGGSDELAARAARYPTSPR